MTKTPDRCPCGAPILADTEDCKVPVCIECAIEISKAYLPKDQNYSEGFIAGNAALQPRQCTDEEIERLAQDHVKLDVKLKPNSEPLDIARYDFKAGFKAALEGVK
jgi:hypothetical protein